MPHRFEPLLELAHAHASAYLDRLPERHFGARASREELIAALHAPFTQQGEAGDRVIGLLAAQAKRGIVASGSARYFGFVVGGCYPVARATDWLTASWDQNAGIYVLSPLAAVAEEVAAGWLL